MTDGIAFLFDTVKPWNLHCELLFFLHVWI